MVTEVDVDLELGERLPLTYYSEIGSKNQPVTVDDVKHPVQEWRG